MRQSKLINRTRKLVSQAEESLNAKILTKAGFIDQTMAGVYSYLPLGYKVLQNIEAIVRDELNQIQAQEMLMPALQPKSAWEQTGRWDTLDVLFRFTSYYTQTQLALGATHEEVITPLSKNLIQSYQDLPLALYQIQTKFRDEKRAKSGILRGREFIMKDLYSFHSSQEDLDQYYNQVIAAYQRIYQRLGIGPLTLKTYASGGTFSKYSHEFQTICPIGEDTIHICQKCQVAINQEIIEEQRVCPECGNDELEVKQSIEVGNIFKLQTKYAQAFNLTFANRLGQEQSVIMGCYGIGISRLMGALVEVLAQDETKMVWPESVAPFTTHLILLNQNNPQVEKVALELYELLQDSEISLLFDDRDLRAGVKFAEADLIGLPHRIVTSLKSIQQGGVELNGNILNHAQALELLSKNKAQKI